MPWDGTELWVAEVSTAPTPQLSNVTKVAGGPDESVFQPAWSPAGVLHYVSDRTNWWNLYREGRDEPLDGRAAEFGVPLWSLGTSTYGFLPDGRPLIRWFEGGADHLGVIEKDGAREIRLGYTTLSGPAIGATHVAVVAGGATEESSIVTFPIAEVAATPMPTVVKRPRRTTLDDGLVSAARPIEFPTRRGQTAHAYFYAPRNGDIAAPAATKPPLVVMSHGGPTSATTPTLNLATQFWTTRGIAVVDVDYGGSTGYGREYRSRLNGEWGVVDVEDCIDAARWLADEGEVDGDRMVIRGGSAGGYTTLCALAFHDVFAAGASYYGVADAARLATDTHKFESRYLDGLIGPYPAAAEKYRQRSPIHFVDQLSRPLILFQGLEDMVVPPSQAEMMVEALAARGIPHAYLAFEGEQHGFRKAETQQRCLEAELYFYSRILGFDIADAVEPVDIKFL
jgi:dipeptidyl aminopeptidase/acylaminoacyl peptidase